MHAEKSTSGVAGSMPRSHKFARISLELLRNDPQSRVSAWLNAELPATWQTERFFLRVHPQSEKF